MILCPNCQHHEITGALFCSECGTQLSDATDDSTQTAEYAEDKSKSVENKWPTAFKPSESEIEKGVSLLILPDEQIINLTGKSQYTIGRATDDQPVVPDIDLTPYGAYDSGVSRLHVTISVGDTITVKDMGSINGTLLNGRKILSDSSQPLFDGDILSLGVLKIQVLIRI
jgi:hypothetical protein